MAKSISQCFKPEAFIIGRSAVGMIEARRSLGNKQFTIAAPRKAGDRRKAARTVARSFRWMKTGKQRTSMIPTDAARWLAERVTIDDLTTAEALESRLRERINTLMEASPTIALFISWTIAGRGPLMASLRRGPLAGELLERLRGDFGYRTPTAWSVLLEVEQAETLPPEWYEQETIRGDFLRAIRQLQMNPDAPLELEQYLSESHRAGTLAGAVSLADRSARDAVLREAASLGVDLLSGEEPQK